MLCGGQTCVISRSLECLYVGSREPCSTLAVGSYEFLQTVDSKPVSSSLVGQCRTKTQDSSVVSNAISRRHGASGTGNRCRFNLVGLVSTRKQALEFLEDSQTFRYQVPIVFPVATVIFDGILL